VNNTNLLKLASLLFPLEIEDSKTDEKSSDSFATIAAHLNAKNFFAEAAIPKEEIILWFSYVMILLGFEIGKVGYRCRLPNNKPCSSDDFDLVVTEAGYCYQFRRKLSTTEGGNNLFRVYFI